MLFGSGKSSSQSVVLLSTPLNVTIASTSECIRIRTLHYEMHFNKILQEARRKSNPHKRRIRSSTVTFSAHRIYQSMIMPIFTYCGYNNLAWPESRKLHWETKPRNHLPEIQSVELWSSIFNNWQLFRKDSMLFCIWLS